MQNQLKKMDIAIMEIPNSYYQDLHIFKNSTKIQRQRILRKKREGERREGDGRDLPLNFDADYSCKFPLLKTAMFAITRGIQRFNAYS